MVKTVIHRNLSIPVRNSLLITRINKGATSAQLESEFNRKIESLLRTLKKHHYAGARGSMLYDQLRRKLRENNLRAEANRVHNPPEKNIPRTVYLVETSTMLNCDMEELLQMDAGTAVFYIPRFCINDLNLMCNDDNRAKIAFEKIYSDGIFNERFFPVNNVSPENSIFTDTEVTKDFKRRTVSIVDAAVELAMSFHSSERIRVKILTTSREVIDLAREVIKNEGLNDILSFALLARKR